MHFILLFLLIMFVSFIFGEQRAYDVTDFGTSAGLISRGRVQGFSNDYSVAFENPASLMKLDSFGFGSFYANTVGGQARFFNLSGGQVFQNSRIAYAYMEVSVPDVMLTGFDGSWPTLVSTFDYRDSLSR